MTLDRVMEKSSIRFPWLLNRQETEELLELIAQNLPGRVNYEISVLKEMQGEPGEVVKEESKLSITGEIKDLRNVLAENKFEAVLDEKDSGLVKEIRFHKVPGWKFTDYNKAIRDLWNNVWQITRQYFDERAPVPVKCIPYREETERIINWTIKSMHVGAPSDYIEELKNVVEKAYSGKPKIKKETQEDGTITYRFDGCIKTREHKCAIQVVGMPIPYADAFIHHADVVHRTEEIDLLSDVIRKEFKKYEKEYNEKQKEAEEFMRDKNDK
ncbi:hypothetical protein AYK26_06105 [Euryarchaeota archaeon SM23-78]|nr:MAG: hypothetical protein AYK26_06105 [Euryarchaeota archaeon SM23-78]